MSQSPAVSADAIRRAWLRKVMEVWQKRRRPPAAAPARAETSGAERAPEPGAPVPPAEEGAGPGA